MISMLRMFPLCVMASDRQDLWMCIMPTVLTLWNSEWVYETVVLEKPCNVGKLKQKTLLNMGVLRWHLILPSWGLSLSLSCHSAFESLKPVAVTHWWKAVFWSTSLQMTGQLECQVGFLKTRVIACNSCYSHPGMKKSKSIKILFKYMLKSILMKNISRTQWFFWSIKVILC